jgi:phage I-like protein
VTGEIRDTLGISIAMNAADAGQPGLRTVRLAPWGLVKSASGDFLIDEQSAEAIVAEFNRRGVEVPVDVEHASLDETRRAEDRAAIGWITRVWGEPSRGLYALVRWTERGRALIQSGGFQYLSPTLLVRKSDRRAVAVDSAAITNRPAIKGMEKLAASRASDTKLARTEKASMEQLDILKGKLGLNGDATPELIVAALSEKLDELAAALAELDGLKSALHAARAEAAVAAAVKSMKLNPADVNGVECARKLALESPETFERLMSAVRPGGPPQGRMVYDDVPVPDARETLIASAVREFRASPQLGKLTSLKAFANEVLRNKSLPQLADAELISFGISG